MSRTILGILLALALAIPAAAEHRPQLSLEDLALLAESGVSEQTILAFVDSRELGFQLDSETVVWLQQQGVGEEVIQRLLEKEQPKPTEARSEPDREVSVSTDPYPSGTYDLSYGAYPSRYYDLYYGYGVLPYLADASLEHWTYGYHSVGHGFFGGHSLGVFVGRSLSDGIGHYSDGGHYRGGGRYSGGRHYRGGGHYSGGRHYRGGESYGGGHGLFGGYGSSHGYSGHSGYTYGGGGHGRSGHSGGGHGGGH